MNENERSSKLSKDISKLLVEYITEKKGMESSRIIKSLTMLENRKQIYLACLKSNAQTGKSIEPEIKLIEENAKMLAEQKLKEERLKSA